MAIRSDTQRRSSRRPLSLGVVRPQQAARIHTDAARKASHSYFAQIRYSRSKGKRIAFVAAPYGFGPSSKAVAISTHLPKSISRDFYGDGPPLELARASSEFCTCTRLDFTARPDEVAKIVADYGAVVFINTTRFLTAVSLNASSLVFVDTLAWIRRSWPSPLPPQSAYFAQRFFDYGFAADLETARSFHATNAIVPKALTTTSINKVTTSNQSPIIHCGGLFSPAMRAGADSAFVSHLCSLINDLRLPMRVILPKHLHPQFQECSKWGASLIECSPVEVGEHIEGSLFALTTSGIEFTYESALLGVPMLFLPPFNATQLLQLDYHFNAVDGCVPFLLEGKRSTSHTLDADTALLQEQGMRGVWAQQFESLNQHMKRLLSGNFLDTFAALKERQQRSLAIIGSDGGREIASYIMSEIGCL